MQERLSLTGHGLLDKVYIYTHTHTYIHTVCVYIYPTPTQSKLRSGYLVRDTICLQRYIYTYTCLHTSCVCVHVWCVYTYTRDIPHMHTHTRTH